MDFTRNENTNYLWKTLENDIEKAESLRTKHSTSFLLETEDALPISEQADFDVFENKVITWQKDTAYHLQSMFKDQTVADFYCPPIQGTQMPGACRKDEIERLKSWLAERIKNLNSLISTVRQIEGL